MCGTNARISITGSAGSTSSNSSTEERTKSTESTENWSGGHTDSDVSTTTSDNEADLDMKTINTDPTATQVTDSNSKSYVINDWNEEPESNITLAACKNKTYHTSGHICRTIVDQYVTRLFCLRVLLPAILTFGTVGNILCIITLLNKTFRKTSTGFILIQMALLDIGQMITSMIEIWNWFISDLSYIRYHPVFSFLQRLLRQLSALTLCMLTVERVVSMYRPMHCRRICSLRRMALVYFIAAAVLTLFNSHEPLRAYCWDRSYPLSKTLRSICHALYSDGYYRFYFDVLPLVDSCLEGVHIPLAFLVIGNALIVVKVIKRRTILGQQTNSQSVKTTSMTVTLVAESVLFVLLNVSMEIINIPAIRKRPLL